MAGLVYFGNAEYQTWIKAPTSGMQAGSQGFVADQQLLNGRAFVKRSRASHRRFQPSWTGNIDSASDNLNIIKAFADGHYGPGPFYWLDPFAMGSNILPPHWAYPGLTEVDWPAIHNAAGGETVVYNTLAIANMVNNVPRKYARYTLPANTNNNYLTGKYVDVYIPTGYTFHFGWSSTAAGITASTGVGVRVIPMTRSTRAWGTASNPASLLYSGTTLTNTTFSGDTYSFVRIYLANGAGASSFTPVMTMTGRVIKNGGTSPTGSFQPGTGTTKLEFTQSPTIEYYSSAVNGGQIGMSASFAEVD